MAAPPMPFLLPEIYGQLIVMVMLVYAGPVDAGGRALAPFWQIAKSTGQPTVDMLKPMAYPEIYPPEMEDYHPTVVSHTMFLGKVGKVEGQTILDYLQASDAPMRVAQLRVLGGAMADIPIGDTAFAHRHEPSWSTWLHSILLLKKRESDRIGFQILLPTCSRGVQARM